MTISIHTIKRCLQGIAIAHIVAGAALPWLVDSGLFTAYHEHLQHVFNTRESHAA